MVRFRPAHVTAGRGQPPARRSGSNEAEIAGLERGLGAVEHPQFSQHSRHVILDRAFGDAQFGADLLVAPSVHQEPQDIEFAC